MSPKLFLFATALVLPLSIFASHANALQDEQSSKATTATADTAAEESNSDKIKVLIVDGQNNHAHWPKTTVMMKQYLIESGKFSVDVARTATIWKGNLAKEFPLGDGKEYKDQQKPKADPDFSPDFASYDVVISNFGYNAAPWPEETKANFEKYMKEGGGLVVVHAADNSWGDWDEFNLMIGLGGWGGRNEKSGPYVYLNEKGEEVRDESQGKGGDHGPQHEFQVVARNTEHPIMKGLPKAWLHSKDELYQKLRGPAENMTILATSFSDPKYRGTGRHEPMIMVLDYGEGRVFHTPMGHADYSMECVGYQTVLLRGTEWAATGAVTLTDVPDDFPTDTSSSSNTFEFKEMESAK
jgi:type 1 glutamine amidotransferase